MSKLLNKPTTLPTHLPLGRNTVIGSILLSGTALGVGMVPVQALASGVDGVQLQLAWQLQQPMRWDNVATASKTSRDAYWAAGKTSHPHPNLAWQVVTLHAGESISVRLPAGEFLRVQSATGPLKPEDVSFWRTQANVGGAGLALRETPVVGTQGNSLALEHHVDTSRIVQIQAAANLSQPLQIGVFVSRHENLGTLAPYRRLYPLSGTTHQLRADSEGAAQDYWAIPASENADNSAENNADNAETGNPAITRVTVRGPARLSLAGRWRYAPNETDVLQNWQVSVMSRSLATGDEATELAQLHYSARAEHSQALWLDGQMAVLSNEKAAYFDVPPGEHELTLRSTGPFLARLLQQEQQQDYRFSQLNANLEFNRVVAKPELQHSPWRLSPQQLQQASQGDGDSALHAAQRVQQDNQHREGSTLAAALLQNAALKQRDDASLRSEANSFLTQHTYLRDLLPEQKHSRSEARFAWYLKSHLTEIGERPRAKVFATQHQEQLLAGLNSARFTPLEHGPAQSWHLPARSAASRLHIALHADTGAANQNNQPGQGSQTDPANSRIMLQFDQQAPFELKLGESTPAHLLASDPALVALQMQHWRFGEYGGSTTDAAFSRTQMPGALLAASAIDIPLPAHVSSVKVWRTNAGSNPESNPGSNKDTPLWLALKLRMAQPYTLSETALLGTLARAQSQSLSIKDLAKAMEQKTSPTTLENRTAQAALHNQLQGLVRFIDSEFNLLANSISAPTQENSPASAATPAAEAGYAQAASAAQAARELAKQVNWLPALEKWAEASHSKHPEIHEQAEQGKIQALQALGETFLAEQCLKQRLLYGSRPGVRQQAAQQLSEIYRSNLDLKGELLVRSAAFMQAQDSANLRALAISLQENDKNDLALLAALLLPAKERPLPMMLRAALQNNWQQLFQTLQAELSSNAEREFWQGQRYAWQGQFEQAATSFRISAELSQKTANQSTPDTAAAEFAAHLQRGQQLHQQIQAERASQANSTLSPPLGPALSPALSQAWADWQASHPGPQQWKEIPSQIIDFAGSHSLYQINQDSYATTYRAEPEKPVKLRFLGPLKLRLEARPLHPRNANTMIEGWLKVEATSGQQIWPVAINQNWPANGAKLIGNDDLLPGQSVLKDLEFGPGWHEIKVSGDGIPLLINARAAVPALPLPVLPLLTEDSLRGQTRLAVNAITPKFWDCRDCVSVIVSDNASTGIGSDAAASTRVMHWKKQLPNFAPGFASMPSIARSSTPSASPAAMSSPTPTQAADSSLSQALARIVATQNWNDFQNLPPAQTPVQVQEQLTALLWRSEKNPVRGQGLLATASDLQAKHPELAGNGGLMERLLRNSEWVPVATVQNSAGMRSRLINHYEPETPALRVRRALLGSTHKDEYLLSGGSRLVLSWFNTQPGRLNLALASRDVSAQPAAPLMAQVQLNNGPIQNINLATHAGQVAHALNLGRGQQSVKVWIKNPLANQFLGVSMQDKNAGRNEVLDASERFYHVATHQEPIKLMIPGPVWLRLDHWVDGQTHSRYRLLDQAWNKFSLTPRAGEKEGLFRIFTRQAMPGRPVTPPRQIEVQPIPVAGPLIQVAAAGNHAPQVAAHAPGTPLIALAADNVANNAAPKNLAPTSAPLPLGGQESGTWSAYGSLSQFKPQTAITGRDKPLVLESGARYRYYDADQHNWYRADLFTRKQQGLSQPGLGAYAALTHDLGWRGIILGANAQVLAQHSNGSANYQAAASAFIKQQRVISPVATHEPKLALFVRGKASSTDQDHLADGVETHNQSPSSVSAKVGFELSDQFTWRPKLDTQLSAQIKLVTGNNLLPKSINTRIGWKALLGQTNAGIRLDTQTLRTAADAAAVGGSKNQRQLVAHASTDIWLNQQHRLELGVSVRRDLVQHRTTAAIGVALNFGNGRGYRDFLPEEIIFRDLRQRRAPETN
jgi:hypothetical protein